MAEPALHFPFEELDMNLVEKTKSSVWPVAMTAGAGYIVTIFALQRVMKHRPSFHLQRTLVAWNLLLSIFSFCCSFRLSSLLLHTWYQHGFHPLVCFATLTHDNYVFEFWAFCFVCSKFMELGDSLFVVLRKKPLIFLHYYHHLTVLLLCGYGYTAKNGPSCVCVTMNATVHAFMYLYYAVLGAGIKLPRAISKTMTTMQILQMVVAGSACGYAYSVKSKGGYCDVPDGNLYAATFLYFTFLLLFINFFYKAYICKGKTDRKKIE